MYDLQMWRYDPYRYLRLFVMYLCVYLHIYIVEIYIYGIVDPISYDKRTFYYKIT